MKTHFERRDKRRYCRFHREYGHDTKECRDLQYQIEDLIRHGHLRRYVRDQSSLPTSRPPQDSSPRPKGLIEKQIDVIFRGPASSDTSSSGRKAYTRTEVGKRLPMTKTSTSHSEPRSKTLMVSFMVVKLPSAYNAIIGPTLNRLKAVVSTYHRLMKFPTRAGVGEVRSDPRESR
ncbi:hypothetical protein BHM03_00015382 [Ensete ventricosum]|nr:hypothetical protein BHM03_00015382 [Ensete ventricosum]